MSLLTCPFCMLYHPTYGPALLLNRIETIMGPDAAAKVAPVLELTKKSVSWITILITLAETFLAPLLSGGTIDINALIQVLLNLLNPTPTPAAASHKAA